MGKVHVVPDTSVREIAKSLNVSNVKHLIFSGRNFGEPYCAPIKITDRTIIENIIASLSTARILYPGCEEICGDDMADRDEASRWIAPISFDTDFLFIYLLENSSLIDCLKKPYIVRFNASDQPVSLEFEAALAAVSDYQAQQVCQQVRRFSTEIKSVYFMRDTVHEISEINHIVESLNTIGGNLFAFTSPNAKRFLIKLDSEEKSEIFCLFVPVIEGSDSWKQLLPSVLWKYFQANAI